MIIKTGDTKLNVVKLDPRDRVVLRMAESCGCSHFFAQFDIYEREKLVRCSDCGGIVDPFVAALTSAKEWERQRGAVEHMRHVRKGLEAEIEDLKRQRKNLRAQVKRAGGTP